MIDTYENHGIFLKSRRSSGEVQCICPQCSHTRKKKTDKCLSVNLDKKCWKCQHCSWSGYLKEDKEEIAYTKPIFRNNTTLSDKAVEWFEKRKISQNTLNNMSVGYGTEWMPKHNKEINTIQFNYFRGENLINTKYRTAAKVFKFEKGAELCFYNENSLESNTDIYFVEGEMDCLTLIESGIKGVLSVPNGANINNNPLPFLDGIIEKLNGKKIYLAFDNDIAGRKLREDFSDRIGKERCDYIEFKECKDANECLVKYGITGIIESINNPIKFPLEGTFTISDFDNEIDDMYVNGLDKGVSTNIPNFNLNIVRGYLTVITGIPSHGKSDFVDYICLKLRGHHNYKGAFFSPENRPTQLHFSKMARKLIGKNWDGFNRINQMEKNLVKEYLEKYVWFIKPEKDFSLDSILQHIRLLQLRNGLDYFVIDAWNKIAHLGKLSTTYIGESLNKISDFCEQNHLHCFLVAHPTKPKYNKAGEMLKPTLYDIAGSSDFYNMVDNGIIIWRNFETNTTEVYRQKVKFDHWGAEGSSTYSYDIPSKRYYNGVMDVGSWIRNEASQETMDLSLTTEYKMQPNTNFHEAADKDCPF